MSFNSVEFANFVKWIFRGSFKDPSFYGLITALLGVAATLAGCPMPYPKYLFFTGLGILIVTGIYYVIRLVHAFYVIDQSRLFNALKKKD